MPPTAVWIAQKERHIVAGRTTDFVCSSDGSAPMTRFEWFLGGVRMVSGPRRMLLQEEEGGGDGRAAMIMVSAWREDHTTYVLVMRSCHRKRWVRTAHCKVFLAADLAAYVFHRATTD